MPEEAKRKFGKKDQTHKNNLLKLVKALLSLAKGELTLEDSQLAAAVKVEWVSEKTLRVNGEYKKKTRTGKEQLKRGTTKQALWQLVEKTDNALELPQRQQENSLSNTEKRQAEVVQDAIYYLEDLAVLKDERPENTKNTKYWIFSLTLKHKNASIEENLGVIKQKLGLETSPAAQETEFLEKPGFCLDWQDCCCQMLPTALSTNPLLFGDGVILTIDDIVPLELVERKQQPQHQRDFSPEHFQVQASTESEVPVPHNQFFEQVLAKGNSDKSQGRKIAIIGEPGAGKSTFLQEIAHWIYPERGLPIFVRLADLQEKSLEEYLLNDWLKNATGKRRIPDDIKDDFVEQFNADRVWLLLDGVDEMGQKFSAPIIYDITRISDYLIKLKSKSQDEEEYKFAKSILRKINSDNQIEAVDALVELINNCQDINIQWSAITIFGEIGSGNQKAIDALVELINNSQDENLRRSAVESLGKIDSGNPIVIDTLVELINNRQKIFLFSSVLRNVGKFGSGNPKAVDALVELVRNSKNESTHSEATESLQKILTEEQMPTVVIALKDTLSEETYENDFERYKHCVEVLWHCAQNLPYPTFYQAWHQQEGEGNTNTPITQTLNPADLPQRLQSAIAKRCCFQQIANNPQLSQTIHLICIDTSKFINPDNPAAKIYTEMVKGGCPKCEDGTPKTMAELQTYWDLLESNKRVVLVFYEGKGSTSQGLSQAFLNNISKFDGAICVISDETKDDIPVKFFAPSQAIEDLLQWLRDI